MVPRSFAGPVVYCPRECTRFFKNNLSESIQIYLWTKQFPHHQTCSGHTLHPNAPACAAQMRATWSPVRTRLPTPTIIPIRPVLPIKSRIIRRSLPKRGAISSPRVARTPQQDRLLPRSSLCHGRNQLPFQPTKSSSSPTSTMWTSGFRSMIRTSNSSRL